MRGIEGPRRDPESFPELLSVTKADPNNFRFLQFSVRGCRVGTAERRKKERKNTCENNGIPSCNAQRTQLARTNNGGWGGGGGVQNEL